MNKKTDKLLEALLEEEKAKKTFLEIKDSLLKRGVESLLKAEMAIHKRH